MLKKVSITILFLACLFFFPALTDASSNQFIIINKAINELAFYEDGKRVKTFPVGTGRTQSMTPEGTFPIVNKIKNRPYYTDGIPGGSPANPLGDRWLGLDARGTYGTTYAIHGNNNPSSIGGYVSAGCVRMYNEDIRWLFDEVELYTKVMIVHSNKTFDELAKMGGYSLAPPIKIILDGKELNVPVAPYLENNRVLVPMRAIFDALDSKVRWDNRTKTITATKDSTKIILTVGSKKATVNGEAYLLDVAPQIRQSTTFVPARFVSEALGVTVKWNGKTRIITLESK